ncbi:MAG: DUF2815 family protein [Eubacterium sp.]
MIRAKRVGTKVITGEALLSYPALFEPKAMDEKSAKKYSASFVFPKTDKDTLKLVKEAIEEAKENSKDLFGGKIPSNLKSPIHDGDNDKPDDAIYAGCYYINAYSTTAPKVVDSSVSDILDTSEIYAGCYVRASINFYAYTKGSKGISAGLNNVQKLRDGDPIGGKSRAEDDFDIIDDDDDDFID